MIDTPKILPLENLLESQNILNEISLYKANNWAIGQLYPDGGPDFFTYFFTVRGLHISNYLRGSISMGEPTAYDDNIETLKCYINEFVSDEVARCEIVIDRIYKYQYKNWAIGESYPNGGPDFFVWFFGTRGLMVVPYLRGTVDIGTPAAYDENIKILTNYIRLLKNYWQ